MKRAAIIIVAALGLLGGIWMVAEGQGQSNTRTITGSECFGAHGWVRYEDGTPVATYSVTDARCPEAVGP